MFEDSTFECNGRIHTHSRGWMMATFLLNGSMLLAMIAIPLVYPEALPPHFLAILMQVPPPPPAAAPARAQPARLITHQSDFDGNVLCAPSKIPTIIRMIS